MGVCVCVCVDILYDEVCIGLTGAFLQLLNCFELATLLKHLSFFLKKCFYLEKNQGGGG